MSFETTDHVSGLSDEQVAALAQAAEAGYDVRALNWETNPHRLQLVPEDLLEAIDQRAREDGESPETVVRRALTAYLRSA